MDYLWIITQTGILLEIVGAVYIVQGAMRARKHIDSMFSSLEGLNQIRSIRDVLKNQARMEFTGFLFLSAGLIMQFIGGFAA